MRKGGGGGGHGAVRAGEDAREIVYGFALVAAPVAAAAVLVATDGAPVMASQEQPWSTVMRMLGCPVPALGAAPTATPRRELGNVSWFRPLAYTVAPFSRVLPGVGEPPVTPVYSAAVTAEFRAAGDHEPARRGEAGARAFRQGEGQEQGREGTRAACCSLGASRRCRWWCTGTGSRSSGARACPARRAGSRRHRACAPEASAPASACARTSGRRRSTAPPARATPARG